MYFLLGDIEEEAEKNLLKMYTNGELKADVLKVAHHGSKTSTSEAFLEAVSPKIALIGVGADNTFGHPSLSTISLLESYDIEIHRTDLEGEIVLEF